MNVKASELRRNLFTLLDRCIETGESIEVHRKNGAVLIGPLRRRTRVADLPTRAGVLVDGDSLDSFSPAEWNP